MADEQTSLIPVRAGSSSSLCIKIYQSSLIHSRGAVIVLIWLSMITISTNILLRSTAIFLSDASSIWGDIPIPALFYLSFPILGYLGERWTRYKVIMVGVSIIVINYVINLILQTVIIVVDVHNGIRTAIEYIWTATILLTLFGFGLFMGNIIQFGTDQLQFAPSHHLAAFARWLMCLLLFSLGIPGGIVVESNLIYYGIYCFSFILLFGFLIMTGCCCKHHLIIEPPPRIDPVKMIWRVMKYAWKHKYPVRRSAFTYCEGPPSRLDLAKERYGGPFTTEQVENVKSFWSIIVVLLPLTANTLTDTFTVAKQYVIFMGVNTTITVQMFVLIYPEIIQYSVAVISIIFFQLVIVQFFSCCIPSMLKRMWIGLVFILFSSITLTIISAKINNSLQQLNHTSFNEEQCQTSNITVPVCLWPYYVLIIPQLLSGVGLGLYYMTSVEFILAQGPHYMQGPLIGILFVQSAVSGINSVITTSTPVGCYWEYYATISSIVFTSLIIYSIAVYRYKYRQRNEISDLNVRVTIEEIYERNLEREAKEREREDDTEYHVQSIN